MANEATPSVLDSGGNPPDIDPANNESLAGTMQFAFYKMLQSVNGMLPAQVIAYDRSTNRVQVQLLIAVVTTRGMQISRPQLASLPVLVLGGGGFMMNFNLEEGDLGWVLANDRDISIFLQSYEESAPNTARVKNFADGLFIPDIMKGYTIAPGDIAAGAAVLQSVDGTVKITLQTGKITISAPLVEIDNFNPTTITPAGGIFQIVGAIQATGAITPFTP